MFLARGLTVALTVATYAVVTRALGASVFGIYSLVIVFHILLIGAGTQTRDLMYLEDCAEFLF